MLRRHHLLVQQLMVFFDAALLPFAYVYGMGMRGLVQDLMGVSDSDFKSGEYLHLVMLGMSLAVVLLGNKLMGLYQSQRMRSLLGEAGRIFAVNLVLFMVLLVVTISLQLKNGNVAHIVAFSIINVVCATSARALVRLIARHTRRAGYNFRNLLVLATSRGEPTQLLDQVASHPFWGFKVLAVVVPEGDGMPSWSRKPLPGNPPVLSFEQATNVLDNEPVDELWVDGFPLDSLGFEKLARSAADQGVMLRYILPREHFPGMHWNFEAFDKITTLAASHSPMDDLARMIKRAIDLFVSFSILAVTIPLIMVPVAILLWLEPGGKHQVLFRQIRVGLHGRHFTCYKFRSMIPDAESLLAELQEQNEMGGPVFKMKRDPRVTRIGAFIRKFSIDESPQFFNVVKGDMSLVGPRPPIPTEVNLYQRTQRRRLSVKPGITGLWQVSGRNEITDFEEWVALDLDYIDRWSLWLDIKILLRTIPAVFRGR